MLELHTNHCIDEQRIINVLDSLPWDTSLKRRTQQYGYRYDFRTRTLIPTTPIPPALTFSWKGTQFTQLIVNEYVGRQGVTAHIDAPCFGDTISVISLGDPCYMRFELGRHQKDVFLPHNSMLVITGKERHEWRHSIRGQNFVRRISLTYRTVV